MEINGRSGNGADSDYESERGIVRLSEDQSTWRSVIMTVS